MKELSGASFMVQAERLVIDVDGIVARVRDRVTAHARALREQALGAQATVAAPSLGMAGVGDAEAVKNAIVVDVGGVALKEILEHADSGEATVTIPLLPRTLKAGPLSLAIEAGTSIVLDVVVRPGGIIDRQATSGRVEPPLKLPLGASVKGISLDASGAVIADLERFPDLNLSALALKGFRIPATLRELVGVLFKKDADDADDADDDETVAPTASAEVDDEGPGLIDTARITVDARGVVPRTSPLAFGGGVGGALELRSGPGTCLDVRYGGGRLHISGDVDIALASIHQAAFDVVDVRGHTRVTADLDFDGPEFLLDLKDLHVDIGRVHAAVSENDIGVADVKVAGGAIHVERGAGDERPRFAIKLPGVAGRITGGQVGLVVGDVRLPLKLRPGSASGSVSVSDQHHQLDLTVDDVGLVVGATVLKAGVVDLALEQAEARGAGRLRVASDGVAFSGALAVSVVTGPGLVDAGAVTVRAERGEGQVTLRELSASTSGLEVLRLDGSLSLVLGAGRIPLLGTHLALSAGATARLSVDELAVEHGLPPRARGSLHVEAAGERCVVDEALLIVPPSKALAGVDRFDLKDGTLVLEGIRAGVLV